MIDLEKRIRAAGALGKKSGGSRKPAYEVFCRVCGRAIRSDSLSDVEYIQTKRGTEQFFHARCLKKGEGR